MAAVEIRISVFCAVFAFFAATASAGQSAPAPAVDCSSMVLELADCLSFVTAGSTTKKPEGTCCSGLKTVLKTAPQCLCEGFKNSAQLGVTLNVSKALSLPAACHVSAPSINNCGMSIGGGAAPALSPSTDAGTPTPIIGALTVPAPAPGSGGGGGAGSSSATTTSVSVLVLAMVAAVSLSLF